MELFQRIKEIIADIEKDQVVFAQKIGVNPRTFQGYLRKARQDNLWPLLPKILQEYPEISREWLYFEEGSKLKIQRTFTNAAGKLVGDLIGTMIERDIKLSPAEFAASIGVAPEVFQEVLESRRAPTWEEMTAMHKNHGININFLLTGQGEDIAPFDELERAAKATGKPLDMFFVSDLYQCEYDEAEAKLKEREKKRTVWHNELIKHKGDSDNAKTGKRSLEKAQADKLQTEYGIVAAWLFSGTGQSHILRDDKSPHIKQTAPEPLLFNNTPAAASSGTVAHTLQKQTEKRQNPTAPAK